MKYVAYPHDSTLGGEICCLFVYWCESIFTLLESQYSLIVVYKISLQSEKVSDRSNNSGKPNQAGKWTSEPQGRVSLALSVNLFV